MNRPKAANIAIDAFYDNFTCAALFRKLRIPGSPAEIIDPRPVRMFWVDGLQQILSEVKKGMNMVALLATVGLVVSAIRNRDSKRPTAEVEDLESFLGDWASCLKP